MKITVNQLRRIIKEEVQKKLSEGLALPSEAEIHAAAEDAINLPHLRAWTEKYITSHPDIADDMVVAFKDALASGFTRQSHDIFANVLQQFVPVTEYFAKQAFGEMADALLDQDTIMKAYGPLGGTPYQKKQYRVASRRSR